MTTRPDRGAVTAEYSIGTLGAVMIALVLHRLGTDGTWLDIVCDIIQDALGWRRLLPGFPRLGLRL